MVCYQHIITAFACLADHYFIFDCPGQAELYTHHAAVATVLRRLSKTLRLCAVHLVDAHHTGYAQQLVLTWVLVAECVAPS